MEDEEKREKVRIWLAQTSFLGRIRALELKIIRWILTGIMVLSFVAIEWIDENK